MQNSPKFVIHVAISDNGIIGNDGKLPWRLPSDIARFRAHTLGRPVIMGRKTFESLGGPLERRSNVVVSSTMKIDHLPFASTDKLVVRSIQQACLVAKKLASDLNSDEIAVIGGGKIYKEFMERDLISRIYVTIVHTVVHGDTRFPNLKPFEWEATIVKSNEKVKDDDEFKSSYFVYNRKNS